MGHTAEHGSSSGDLNTSSPGERAWRGGFQAARPEAGAQLAPARPGHRVPGPGFPAKAPSLHGWPPRPSQRARAHGH